MDLLKIKTRVKIVVSNKGTLLEEKLNEALAELEDEGKTIKSIQTNISFSGSTGYQAIGTITYMEEYYDQIDPIDFNINFGIGEPSAIDSSV